jgi:hypothetical protein
VDVRIYEYQDDDGTVYWSLTKRKQIISHPLRLVMVNRIGTHLLNFLANLRQNAEDMAPKDG